MHSYRYVTPQEVKDAVQSAGVRRIECRTCSLCNAPLYYVFHGDDVFFDSNCGCTSYHTQPQHTSWQHLTRQINIQPSREARNRMRAKFFLTPEVDDVP